MSAIQTVRTRTQQLIASVTQLGLLREWYTLQSSEDLAAWIGFLMRLEQQVSQKMEGTIVF